MGKASHIIGLEENNALKKAYDTLSQNHQKLQSDYQYLQQQLSELKRMIFGSKSERFISLDPGQLGLFAGTEQSPELEDVPTIEVRYKKNKASTKQQPIRSVLPSHLPRVEEIIEPKGLGQGAKKIGEEITEVLEYNPAKIFVRKIIRPKYVIKASEQIVIGDLPSLPIPKGNAGAGLLAHIVVSKFVDHLPFYRQQQILKRQELIVSQATIGGWFNASANLLEPLYDTLEKQTLQSSYLQIDESPIGVQDSHKKGKLHRGYHWVHHAPVEGLVLFKYDPSRSKQVLQTFLQDFKGTVQSDGYAAYQYLEDKKDVVLLSCMAHARRYFEKALENDDSRASYALKHIQALYAIERRAREAGVDFQVRKRYRRRYARPILNALEKWLKEQLLLVLPKSSIGKAIAYTLRLWPRLVRYTTDGRYQIDNNLIENTIRPLALGRKNYLFAGSHKAAQRAAMFYSFFATCKVNDIEPYAWLKDVLERIPEHKANRLAELLPLNDYWEQTSNRL